MLAYYSFKNNLNPVFREKDILQKLLDRFKIIEFRLSFAGILRRIGKYFNKD